MVPHHHCSPADQRGWGISVDMYHLSLTSQTLECHILKPQDFKLFLFYSHVKTDLTGRFCYLNIFVCLQKLTRKVLMVVRVTLSPGHSRFWIAITIK